MGKELSSFLLFGGVGLFCLLIIGYIDDYHPLSQKLHIMLLGGVFMIVVGLYGIVYPKHLITRYSPRLVSFLPCQRPKIKS